MDYSLIVNMNKFFDTREKSWCQKGFSLTLFLFFFDILRFIDFLKSNFPTFPLYKQIKNSNLTKNVKSHLNRWYTKKICYKNIFLNWNFHIRFATKITRSKKKLKNFQGFVQKYNIKFTTWSQHVLEQYNWNQSNNWKKPLRIFLKLSNACLNQKLIVKR